MKKIIASFFVLSFGFSQQTLGHDLIARGTSAIWGEDQGSGDDVQVEIYGDSAKTMYDFMTSVKESEPIIDNDVTTLTKNGKGFYCQVSTKATTPPNVTYACAVGMNHQGDAFFPTGN